jgi:NTE family protein
MEDQRTKLVDDFIKKTGVDEQIKKFKESPKGKDLVVSDVTDDDNQQYVNLVQQGGGVWGVSLIGYVYVLEQMGIRFFSLAGTSAGAINAMAMAAIKEKNDEKSIHILDLFLKLDLKSFIDGKKGDNSFNRWEKKLISTFIKFPFYGTFLLNFSQWMTFLILFFSIGSWLSLVFFAFRDGKLLHYPSLFLWTIAIFLLTITYYRLKKIATVGFGLNSGDAFYNWIKNDVLAANGIHNLEDLKNHFSKTTPKLKLNKKALLRNEYKIEVKAIKDDADTKAMINLENDEEVAPVNPKLAIITSDITTNNKIEFPRMWKLYYPNLQSANPADFVRASMSIPVFFETYKLKVNPAKPELWNQYLNWDYEAPTPTHPKTINPLPQHVNFVDGGSLSNFPINIFYNQNQPIPRMPTFGVRLVEKKDSKINSFKGVLDYISNVINTMKLSSDKDFINKNKSYDFGIGYVQLGTKLSWLNFYMGDLEKQELFIKGAEAAIDFLEGFNWDEYKKEREKNFIDNQKELQHNPNNW